VKAAKYFLKSIQIFLNYIGISNAERKRLYSVTASGVAQLTGAAFFIFCGGSRKCESKTAQAKNCESKQKQRKQAKTAKAVN
jgi:hypothetical protein